MEEAMRFREPYSGDALDALLDYLTEHYWDHNGPTYGLLAVLAAAKEVSDSE